MLNSYRAVIESVLTFSLTAWFGSSTVQQRSRICNITRAASKSIGCDLPTIDEIYVSRLQKKGLTILKDPLHQVTTPYNRVTIQLDTSLRLFLQADLEQLKLSLRVFWTVLIVGLSMLLIPRYLCICISLLIIDRTYVYSWIYLCLCPYVCYHCWFQTTMVFGNK